MTPPTNAEQCAKWLSRFITPDQLTELRALGVDGNFVYSGWFLGSQLNELAEAAMKFETRSKGVYFTPNPVRGRFSNIAPGIMTKRGITTADGDILERRWILIDVDPVRIDGEGKPLDEEGQKLPTTDLERNNGFEVIANVKHNMDIQGFQGGILSDSGNGWHVCYPCLLSNDDASKAMHKELLIGLENRIGSELAHVDHRTYNAARIWKVYFTKPRKGVESAGRSYRVSWCVPEHSDETGWTQEAALNNNEKLPRLLKLWRKQDELSNRSNASESLNEPIERAKAYLRKADPAIQGQDGSGVCFRVAMVLVEGFGLSDGDALTAIQDWNTRCQPVWSERELIHKISDARKKIDPSKVGHLLKQERKEAIASLATGQQIEPGSKPLLGEEEITCDALMMKDIPDPRYIVEKLLPEGLTIFAARPKAGKSWLALQLALGIAQGEKVLGGLETLQGSVLYLALEDNHRRLKKRVGKLLASTNWIAPPNLFFRTQSPKNNQGGIDLVRSWLDDHPDAKMVIVDTLAKARPVTKARGDGYSDDYEAIGEMKILADHFRIAVLVIHHSRKADSESPFDQISGTLGLTGAADSMFVLQRNHNSGESKLYVTGRDIDEETLNLGWEKETAMWTIESRDDGIIPMSKGPDKTEEAKVWVIQTLKTTGEMLQKDLKANGGKEVGCSAKTIYRAIREMVRDNILISEPAGFKDFVIKVV